MSFKPQAFQQPQFRAMATSISQLAKRAFLTILLALARQYGVDTGVGRDSEDSLLDAAFRKVIRRVHPDKGGKTQDAQSLQGARDKWQELRKTAKSGPPKKHAQPPRQAAVGGANVYRIRSLAIMLTYHVPGFASWLRFLSFVTAKLDSWKIRYWCATMEKCKSGKYHIHLMLQFWSVLEERTVDMFKFGQSRPNASTNDLCGEGQCRKRHQQSVDRGFFYVWADKLGTVFDRQGQVCTDGNYCPCWTESVMSYTVLGKWPETLWKQRKLGDKVYEQLLFLSRDGVLGRKRNLDSCREHVERTAAQSALEARVKRIRGNPSLYKPFPTIPAAVAWLKLFLLDAMRYPVLIVMGPSRAGKTEWAKSLFKHALELKIGSLEFFPDRMREFDKTIHDGIVLDDVRDLAFLVAHQDKLQGKYDTLVEFGSTAGGTCAFSRDLFAVPLAVTVNYSTANLDFLNTDDWLNKAGNRVVVNYTGFLGS